MARLDLAEELRVDYRHLVQGPPVQPAFWLRLATSLAQMSRLDRAGSSCSSPRLCSSRLCWKTCGFETQDIGDIKAGGWPSTRNSAVPKIGRRPQGTNPDPTIESVCQQRNTTKPKKIRKNRAAVHKEQRKGSQPPTRNPKLPDSHQSKNAGRPQGTARRRERPELHHP